MALKSLNEVLVWAIWLCWSALVLTLNALKNLDHHKIFTSPRKLKEILLRTDINFAPGLFLAVQPATPPDLDFFKALPLHLVACWAVYLLVLEKEHCMPKIYIGSATNHEKGILVRLHQYQIRTALPDRISKAFDEGYDISHAGFLCWANVPPAAARVATRALFLILETVFSLLFWPMVPRTKDYFMPRLCPWPIRELAYDGLCTHFAINEGIVGIAVYDEGLTEEQIEALDQLNYQRTLERRRIAGNKWLNERGGKAMMSVARKKLRLNNLAEKKYFCALCEVNCGNQSELNVHNTTPRHEANASGTRKTLKKPGDKALTDRNVNLKRFFCRPCDKAYPSNSDLKAHLKTPKHARNLAKLKEPS